MGWIRECQECGHRQKDTKPNPNIEPTNAYCNRKCKKCKSEALDYGKGANVKIDLTIEDELDAIDGTIDRVLPYWIPEE